MAGAERSRPTPLPGLEGAEAARVLRAPWLPAPAAARAACAEDAAALGLPLLLAMPHGAFRLRVARALHALARRRGRLLAVRGPRPLLERPSRDTTLLIDVATLADADVPAVEALLDDGAPWILLALSPGATLPDALATRAGALVLEVPPLARRRDELPALAVAVVERLAARRGDSPPELTDDALLALHERAWPGDLGELEATLGHALLAARGEPIDAGHLPLPVQPPAVPPPTPPEDPVVYGARLETVVQELAHEIRNPLTALKPYIDCLPAVIADPEAQARLSEVGPEAIARIDSLLEHVLEFARLGRPVPTAVPVAPILDALVGELRDELRARDVVVRRTGGDGGVCAADRTQLEFALRSLFVGVAQEVPPHEELTVDASRNGVVQLGFRTGGTTVEHLRRLTTPGGTGGLTDPRALPLSFTLARTVLERNGGTLGVEAEPDGRTALVVRLATADD